MGGGCLPYYKDAQNRQPWLNQFLYQWKSELHNRDREMPHIKSRRYSNEGLFWFVLTSANMSKSAWGVYKGSLYINSYEVGVAMFPRVMLDCGDHFPMNKKQQKSGTPVIKMPFDISPVPYEADDQPFCIEDMRDYQRVLMVMQGLMSAQSSPINHDYRRSCEKFMSAVLGIFDWEDNKNWRFCPAVKITTNPDYLFMKINFLPFHSLCPYNSSKLHA